MPRFSVIVPTFARVETLEHALATVLAQTVDNYEVVVQNNGNDPATRELVERLGDPHLRVFHTDDVVSMVENWELALANATGELITVIGDDDGLLPDACEAAGHAIDLTGAEIVSWAPFLYLWPSYWYAPRRNRLHAHVTFDFVVRVESSRAWLERFYAFETDYASLPMLYNSFVSRSVIDRIRDRYGKYFLAALPDVTSGIVNAVETETFAKSSRPLSIAGISGRSHGNRLSRDARRFTQAELELHFPELLEQAEPQRQSDLVWLVSIDMAVLEEEVIRERQPIHFDRRRLAWAIVETISESPSRYDETRELVEQLMLEYDIGPDELEIPPPTTQPLVPPDGAHLIGPSEVFFVLDGNRFGLQTVADAAGLAGQLVPAAGAIVREESPSRPTVLAGLKRRALGRA